MLPSEYKIMKREQNKKPKVHSKVSNTFIENAISRSNLSALKTLYYLSTVLSEKELEKVQENKIIGIKIDKREMLKFTELSADTIIKTVKQMQETSITFVSYDNDGDEVIEGMNLLPRYYFVPNKNIIELDLYARVASMIVNVKKNYTNINVKELMLLKNKHSLRLLALLCRISQYDLDIAKRKSFTLESLREFFGVNYTRWSQFEIEIIKPIKEELDNNSKLSFVYQSNFEKLGTGRPSFRSLTIDLIEQKNPQGKLF